MERFRNAYAPGHSSCLELTVHASSHIWQESGGRQIRADGQNWQIGDRLDFAIGEIAGRSDDEAVCGGSTEKPKGRQIRPDVPRHVIERGVSIIVVSG